MKIREESKKTIEVKFPVPTKTRLDWLRATAREYMNNPPPHFLEIISVKSNKEQINITYSISSNRASISKYTKLSTYINNHNRRHMSIKIVSKWLRDILEGLEYMHSRGIFHTKVTPESIYVNSEGEEARGVLLPLGEGIGMEYVYPPREDLGGVVQGRGYEGEGGPTSYIYPQLQRNLYAYGNGNKYQSPGPEMYYYTSRELCLLDLYSTGMSFYSLLTPFYSPEAPPEDEHSFPHVFHSTLEAHLHSPNLPLPTHRDQLSLCNNLLRTVRELVGIGKEGEGVGEDSFPWSSKYYLGVLGYGDAYEKQEISQVVIQEAEEGGVGVGVNIEPEYTIHRQPDPPETPQFMYLNSRNKSIDLVPRLIFEYPQELLLPCKRVVISSPFPKYAQIVQLHSRCFLIGGIRCTSQILASCFELTLAGELQPLSAMTQGRIYFGVCCTSQIIFIIGGVGEGFRYLSTCEMLPIEYMVHTDYKYMKWLKLPSLPRPICKSACCVFHTDRVLQGVKTGYGNVLYSFGGLVDIVDNADNADNMRTGYGFTLPSVFQPTDHIYSLHVGFEQEWKLVSLKVGEVYPGSVGSGAVQVDNSMILLFGGQVSDTSYYKYDQFQFPGHSIHSSHSSHSSHSNHPKSPSSKLVLKTIYQYDTRVWCFDLQTKIFRQNHPYTDMPIASAFTVVYKRENEVFAFANLNYSSNSTFWRLNLNTAKWDYIYINDHNSQLC